jgi:oligoendopeptidase F
MATPTDEAEDIELAAAVWDLAAIVDGGGDAGALALLDEARTRADALADRLRGRIRELGVDELAAATRELDAIHDLLLRASIYAELRTNADSADTAGAQLQGAVEERKAQIEAVLLFFELEWVALEDDAVEALLAGDPEGLENAGHYLRRLRSRRPYLLSPAEEQILAETSVPRLAAWKRLYFENASRLSVDLDGETMPLTEALARLDDARREVRLAAADALAPALEAGLSTRVAAYNQVFGEKAIDDRLRGYPTWLTSRNLDNEASDESVAALLSAIRSRADIVQGWYRTKAKLLEIDRLRTSDINAPLPSDRPAVAYGQARDTVLEAWGELSPRAEALLAPFFEGRIDAPIRHGKQSGAFSASGAPSAPGYVLVNYGSRLRDTLILAHELGHGLHGELVRPRGALQARTSIPMHEVASTFSEAVVNDFLLRRAASDAERLEIIAAQLDDAMMNVFWTAALADAEAGLHARRREAGELSADGISAIWTEAQERAWGDTVEVEPAYRLWWSHMPHLVMEPGYLYSYSYGLLVSWSAYARFREEGAPFVEKYLEMLAAGGSRSPRDLLAMIGLDLEDPAIWDAGLDLLEARVAEAEALA